MNRSFILAMWVTASKLHHVREKVLKIVLARQYNYKIFYYPTAIYMFGIYGRVS